jgi:hypothetical protein
VSAFTLFGVVLPVFHTSEASCLTTHTFRLAVLKKRKVEDHGDFILGPVSPKEYKEAVAKLNGSRTNRVFEFFKIVVLERVGFAKHRKAAERKAATLAAADAEAGETVTSLRTASTRKTGTRNAPAAAATAAAEGKARKKRGGRPADSPRRPKEPGSWTSRLTSSKT